MDDSTLRHARLMYELFDQGKLDEAATYVAPDAPWIDMPSGTVFHGPEGFKQFMGVWRKAFPDATQEITGMFASGEWVTTEFVGHGTHRGPLEFGPLQIAPTGRKIAVRFCEIVQIQHGKAVAGRLYYDVSTLLSQIQSEAIPA